MRALSSVLVLLAALAACVSFPPAAAAQDDEEEVYGLRVSRRVNAHGDEYMGLAATGDGRRLVVGTEKGEVLVWGLAERRFIRRLRQGSPVHSVVMLKDGRHVLAAGGPHVGAAKRGVLRLWDLAAGTYEEWAGAERGSVTLVSYDAASGLVAALVGEESVAVWNAADGKRVAAWDLGRSFTGLALAGRTVYASAAQPRPEGPGTKEGEEGEEEEEEEGLGPNSVIALDAAAPHAPAREVVAACDGRVWGELKPSPGGRLLAALLYQKASPSYVVALLDASTGRELATFEGVAAVWSSPDVLLISGEDGQPTQRVRVAADGEASAEKIAEGTGWHADGTPGGLSAQVASKDGGKVWATYQRGAALVEWDLDKKEADVLAHTKGFPYALDVLEKGKGGAAGLLITGGDERFVRVWNLADLSLLREFRVPAGVPQGVALLPGGTRAVFSYGPGKGPTVFKLADLRTGEARTVLEVREPSVDVHAAAGGFVYRRGDRIVLTSPGGTALREFGAGEPVDCYAVSHNGRWLAVAGKSGALSLFEVSTGRRVRSKTAKIENVSRIAVTGDGRYVYTTEWTANIRRWDTRADTSDRLGDYRGQSAFLRLSVDERRVVIGGNQRDIGVYDAANGKALAYFRVPSSDFHVTNGWLSRDRLIFTDDSGVMYDGALER